MHCIYRYISSSYNTLKYAAFSWVAVGVGVGSLVRVKNLAFAGLSELHGFVVILELRSL